MNDSITVAVYVDAPLPIAWQAYRDPEAVKHWNAAVETWHTTEAHNDFVEGGTFSYRMEAKDGSEGFDFSGVYTSIVLHESIAYTLADGRNVFLSFSADGNGVNIVERFEPEQENSKDMQQAGWQAILDNFKKYVETVKRP